MKEKSFVLEDYKPAFQFGKKYFAPTGKTRAGTGFWYKFLTLFPQHKPFLKKPSHLTRIVSAYNANMIEACTQNRAGVEFPEGLGVLFVGSYRTSKNTNHGESGKIGKRVYHRNLHTGNLAACIYYDTGDSSYSYHELWDFSACLNFKTQVSQAFRKNWNLYFRLETLWKALSNRKKSYMKSYAIKKQNELLKDYNEFYIS